MAYMRNNLVGDGAVVLQNVVVLCTDGLCDLFGDGLFFFKNTVGARVGASEKR